MDWRDDAACAGEHKLFLAPSGERPEARADREAQAGQLCRVCPVMDACRTWARTHREYGYWAGESEEQRALAGFRVELPVGNVTRAGRLYDQGMVAR